MLTHDLKAFFPFIGIGGSPRGFQKARPHIRGLQGRWRVIGGIDNDTGAVANASRILAARIANMDLFSAEQYEAFHGRKPPEGWREVTAADVRAAAGGETPDLILTSPPCKGYSGLLAEQKSKTNKYQALNELALRGVWLCLEAFADDPPSFFLLENVPRMMTRGRRFIDQLRGLLHAYGYATAETVHDCGVIGGLAQSRKRLLLVARHTAKVPVFLYQPPSKPLRAVGDVLGKLPVPGPESTDLPLHRLPRLQWKTWVRLAFVEAGSDWRSLNRLAIEDEYLKDYAIVPAFRGAYGVQSWAETASTVCGRNGPTNGTFAVADPRFDDKGYNCGQYGVGRWGDETGAVINVKSPGQGGFCVADPRVGKERPMFSHAYRVVRWDRSAPAVHGPGGAGGMAVADPRHGAAGAELFGKYPVTGWEESAGTLIGGSTTGQGAYAVADPRPAAGPLFSKYAVSRWDGRTGTVIGGDDQGAYAVADPRPNLDRSKGYVTGGHYGVVPWAGAAYAITGSGQHDNGHNNVADPRVCADSQTDRNACLPAPNENLQCLIVAEDGTWHRPFTTLECAALQSLFDIDEYRDFQLTGGSDGQVREWIGNAIPSDAAEAMAEVFGHALLLAASGETFVLSSAPMWVQPMVAAIQFGTTAS